MYVGRSVKGIRDRVSRLVLRVVKIIQEYVGKLRPNVSTVVRMAIFRGTAQKS